MCIIGNPGKIFETSLSKSIPGYCLVKRLNDNAAGWAHGEATRFASDNECDFIVFDCSRCVFYGLELKSTKGKSLTFWRNDFDVKNKKQNFVIRKCQILGLDRWSKFKNCICGFIINFRNQDNRTFFINIIDFLDYTKRLDKKSINFDDVLKMNSIEIESNLLKVNYKYNMEKFLKQSEVFKRRMERV